MSEVIELGVFFMLAAYAVLALILAFWAAAGIRRTRKNLKVHEAYNYRKHLTHMIVAGTLKRIAKDHELDLEKEEDGFSNYLQRFKSLEKAEEKELQLDDEIEATIQDDVRKLNEEVDKKK